MPTTPCFPALCVNMASENESTISKCGAREILSQISSRIGELSDALCSEESICSSYANASSSMNGGRSDSDSGQ